MACAALLASADGRAFLNWLFEICGFLSTGFSLDPQQNAFRAGQENVARTVYAYLGEVDPEGLINLLKENLNAARADAALRASDERGTGEDAGEWPGADSGSEYP